MSHFCRVPLLTKIDVEARPNKTPHAKQRKKVLPMRNRPRYSTEQTIDNNISWHRTLPLKNRNVMKRNKKIK